MDQKWKMYILVKENIPIGKAVVGIAHASLACFLKYQDSDAVASWLSGPFYKTVCKVSDREFEKAKEEHDFVIITESSLDNSETILAFCPRIDYPKYFRYFQLFK